MTFRSCAAAVLFILSNGAVPAAGVDDYVFWKTVELVDANCHYLKSVERRVTDRLTNEALAAVPQTMHYNTDRISEQVYDLWLTGTDARAAAEAGRVGCTRAAEPLLLRARGVASEAIYQDLLLAFHFNGVPVGQPLHQALAADQIKAATNYDQFLQQVYGANFPAFATAQRDAATRRLPQQSVGLEYLYAPFGAGAVAPGPDLTAIWNLQSGVRQTVSNILFEVHAEIAGYRIWPELINDIKIEALHPGGSTEASAHLISGPESLEVVGGGKMSAVLVRMLSGELWLMSYGAPVDAGAAVALLIRTTPLPEGTSALAAWSGRDWRSLATRYDLTPVASSCLGAPCWKVPQAARDRLLEISAFEDVELWVAADPAATPDADSFQYDRNNLRPSRLHIVEGRPQN